MSLDIFWFLPTSGDTRYLGKSDFGRAPSNAYLRQIAVTAEHLGYDGLLIPTGSSCLDPWITAARNGSTRVFICLASDQITSRVMRTLPKRSAP